MPKHQHSHTWEKPCNCCECGKKFTNSSDCLWDQVTYNEEWPIVAMALVRTPNSLSTSAFTWVNSPMPAQNVAELSSTAPSSLNTSARTQARWPISAQVAARVLQTVQCCSTSIQSVARASAGVPTCSSTRCPTVVRSPVSVCNVAFASSSNRGQHQQTCKGGSPCPHPWLRFQSKLQF